MNPIISVIVCTYNRGELLVQALESLVTQSLEKSRYEVIVVNNNSTDNTEEIAKNFVEKYDNFRLVNEPKQGLSHARNRGYQEAKGDYVAYIDDDAKATENWLELIIKDFQNVSPTPVAVGGEIRPWYEVEPPDWFIEEFEIITRGDTSCFLKPEISFTPLCGSNMALQKKVLESSGGFSPEFGMQGTKIRLGEETLLFNIIYEDYPYIWYNPEIKVYHWTSKEKLTMSYMIKRQYMVGICTANIAERKIFSAMYFRKMFGFFVMLLKFPFIMLKHPDMTTFIIHVKFIVMRYAFLFGKRK